MAEHHQAQRPTTGDNPFLRKLHDRSPKSTQLIGFLTLVISSTILLLFTGITLTATVLGLIFFMPLIIISSPIWLPVGTVIFISIAGFLSMSGFGVAVLAVLTWIYKYFRGRLPVGSGQVDYARTRLADTASQMKDYAWDYGGFLRGKFKDTAPSA